MKRIDGIDTGMPGEFLFVPSPPLLSSTGGEGTNNKKNQSRLNSSRKVGQTNACYIGLD